MTAKLVDCKDGVVRLKRGNGQIVSLPLEKLSDADQQYLKRQLSGVGSVPAGSHAKASGPGSVDARPRQANTRSQQKQWYSAGPGWRKLDQLAQFHGISLYATNHGEKQYEEILAKSQPGSTIVLLFALDSSDKNIPDSYRDLLPIAWAEIEAKLKKGETVQGSGRSRDREIILLAAPTESQLNELIRTTKLLSGAPANR